MPAPSTPPTSLSPFQQVDSNAASPTRLPPHLLEALADQPPNVDRQTGARLITRHIFPVSHRSLEAWPLPIRRVNGRAVIPTATLFEVAYAKFAEAPVIMSGRKAASHKDAA